MKQWLSGMLLVGALVITLAGCRCWRGCGGCPSGNCSRNPVAIQPLPAPPPSGFPGPGSVPGTPVPVPQGNVVPPGGGGFNGGGFQQGSGSR